MKNINFIKFEELERVCDFLELDLRDYKDENGKIISCEIIWPFEGNYIDEYVVSNGKVLATNSELTQAIKELKEHRAKIKTLQNKINSLIKMSNL